MSSYGQIAQIPASIATYAAASTPTAPAAATTDLFTLTGADNIEGQILYIGLNLELSAVGATTPRPLIVKRSAANTGGTSGAVTAVPLSSEWGAAACSVLAYTANPAALGASVGRIISGLMNGAGNTALFQSNAAGVQVPVYVWTPGGDALSVRAATEVIAVNFNGVLPPGTIAGGGLCCTFIWTEKAI